MLQWVSIKNLALIEAADVEFDEGFNVITGETGAGKSVLMSTISLLLGERADKNVIRSGAERCELAASITLPPYLPEEFHLLLREAGVEPGEDSTLQLKRVITPAKTRNFINDTPVTLQTLAAAGDYLVDIHGANEHQSLLHQSTQLRLLDRYAGHDQLIAGCAALCAEIRNVEKRREELLSQLPSAVEAGHLRMIIEEISRINPQPGEDDEINARHRLAANSRQIVELTSQAAAALNGGEQSAADILADVFRALSELARIDPDGCAPLVEACSIISESINELSCDVESYASRIELNEEEFQNLENRLGELQRLKRRYGPGLDNVINTMEEASARLSRFEDSGKLREQLDAEIGALREKLAAAAETLSSSRQKAAARMTTEISAKLRKLGFLKSSLHIDFSAITPGANGKDRVDMMFSPNPGENPQPLRNIASSGEISRVMLAIKTVLAEADAIPILVFDEIDANIGGETAVKVGEELLALASKRQILCISHLPQVASMGNTHFLVSKDVRDERTTSSISRLDRESRTGEIARMLGGNNAARRHAEELLANKY